MKTNYVRVGSSALALALLVGTACGTGTKSNAGSGGAGPLGGMPSSGGSPGIGGSSPDGGAATNCYQENTNGGAIAYASVCGNGSGDLFCTVMGGGGEGGEAQRLSAIESYCRSGRDVPGNSPLDNCLNPRNTASACPERASIASCLQGSSPPCRVDLEASGCKAIMNACPELREGACAWAVGPGGPQLPASTKECFDQPRDGEACLDRFLRCAWNI